MTYRITRGDNTFEVDTVDELRAMLDVFENPIPGPTGTVRDVLIPDGARPLPEGMMELFTGFDVKSEPLDAAYTHGTVSNGPVYAAPQMIPVRTKLLDMLEVLMTFPEGITCRGISTLTGTSVGAVSHRLGRLKQMGLAESVPKSANWRATQLARTAKLVRS
jgi:hypothetical protein